MNEIQKMPTMAELVSDTEMSHKGNAFMVLVNQNPPENWVQKHPMIQGYNYLPIERVEYLLTRIFGKWWVEIKSAEIMANSAVVTVRLWVTNPITGKDEFQDGVGAMPIQTDKGQGAMDWNFAKSDGVQKAVPAAESFAIKDAAEKFGKLFGKDIARKNNISYNSLLKVAIKPTLTDNEVSEAIADEIALDEMKGTYELTESQIKLFDL